MVKVKSFHINGYLWMRDKHFTDAHTEDKGLVVYTANKGTTLYPWHRIEWVDFEEYTNASDPHPF